MLPRAGIAERASALNERLARIADYATGSVRRSVFTVLVVLGVGVVFGADEKKDATPARAAPEATPSAPKPPTEPPAWGKGWSVAKVVIPSDGEIKDAFVDLHQPDGKTVTLYLGQRAKAGVMLSSVGLAWSPARAQVRLRKDKEQAELFAEAALISKSATLKREAGHVEIEGRFIEVPETVALALKSPSGGFLFSTASKNHQNPLGGIAFLFTAEQVPVFLGKLLKTKGSSLLSAPRVTTKSGQRSVIEVIREFRYPTEWEKDAGKKGEWVPTSFETRNVGVTLEVEATIGVENTLDLLLTPQVVEYLGIVDVETGKTVASGSVQTEISHAGRKLRPVFSTRKITTDVSIFSGQSLVLTGFGETEDTKPFKPKTPGRRLIVIVTARQLNDDGTASPTPRR